MKILEEIADGYKKLFDKTGKIEFFMHAKNIEKLNADIMGIDLEVQSSEPELTV